MSCIQVDVSSVLCDLEVTVESLGIRMQTCVTFWTVSLEAQVLWILSYFKGQLSPLAGNKEILF